MTSALIKQNSYVLERNVTVSSWAAEGKDRNRTSLTLLASNTEIEYSALHIHDTHSRAE